MADELERLKALLPSQFTELVYRLRIPDGLLPSSSEPQVERAIAVLRYTAQDAHAREMLGMLLRQTERGPRSAMQSTDAVNEHYREVISGDSIGQALGDDTPIIRDFSSNSERVPTILHKPRFPYDSRAFGKRLREFRNRAGLSQTELGAAVFVSSKRISAYEQGTDTPSFEQLEILGTALGRSRDELLDGLPPRGESNLEDIIPRSIALRDDFFSRVEELCRLWEREGTVERRRSDAWGDEYLHVSTLHNGFPTVYPVAAVVGDISETNIQRFVNTIVASYLREDPGLVAVLVYGGSRVSDQLLSAAIKKRINLRSYVEYQGLIDFRRYLGRQKARLAADPLYPPSLYVPQEMSVTTSQNESQMAAALGVIEGWLATPYGRFIVILGDSGVGKTFLLHELARRQAEQQRGLVPVLVEMRMLDKAHTFDALIAQHFALAEEDVIDLKAFRHMLAEGRILLLFDGFDELALRVTYERAADHFDTLLQAASGNAKIVVTSRTQHFYSDQQVHTALANRAAMTQGYRVGKLLPFSKDQIHSYLHNRLSNPMAADMRYQLLSDIRDLLGLSANPRMLSFLTEIPQQDLLEDLSRSDVITSARIYERLLERWLGHEVNRAHPPGSPVGLSKEQRWDAVTEITLRLWWSGEKNFHLRDLSPEIAYAVETLAPHDLAPGELAQQVGSGTVLIRDEHGAFTFIHSSIQEYLVVRAAVNELTRTTGSEILTIRTITPLMVEFLVELRGADATETWALLALAQKPSAAACRNALTVLRRLNKAVGPDRNFINLELSGLDFSEMDVSGADFSGADLTDARFVGANLTGSRFCGSKLARSDLRGARLDGAIFTDADLRGAHFDTASIIGVAVSVDIWSNALRVIETRINRHYFEMWFRPIGFIGVIGDRLLLSAPNRYIEQWFTDNYLATVLEEIRAQTQRDYQVTFEIVEPPAVADDATGTARPGRADTLRGEIAAPPNLLEKFSFSTFVTGPSNQLACAAAMAVAEVPAGKYNPLFIYGGVGLGKTHLVHAIGHSIYARNPTWRIVYLKTEAYMNEYVLAVRNNRIDDFRRKYREQCDVLLMDDIQFLAGKDRTQEEFFHTFNSLFESDRQIVVTADTYPHEIPDLEDRIRSRFQWGLIADIQAPELETRIAILEKKAEVDAIDLSKDVAIFLATHIKSNVRELEGLLIRLAALSSLQSRPITIAFARETLKNFLTQASSFLTVEAVQKEVANYYNVKLADLKSPRRHQAVARPRQIAMYLARKLVKASYPELGQRFGGKDHTNVMAACRKIEKLVAEDPQTRHEVQEIERHLTQ